MEQGELVRHACGVYIRRGRTGREMGEGTYVYRESDRRRGAIEVERIWRSDEKVD